MAKIAIKQQIIEEVDKLSPDQQRHLLEYARTLHRPRGEPGKQLVQHAREISFPPDDLVEIKKAIEDCERIDLSEWDIPG